MLSCRSFGASIPAPTGEPAKRHQPNQRNDDAEDDAPEQRNHNADDDEDAADANAWVHKVRLSVGRCAGCCHRSGYPVSLVTTLP